MTTRLSIVSEFPKRGWGDLQFPVEKPVNWYFNVVFLRRMWELGQDTILETAFYEPLKKPVITSSPRLSI
jgi:hypothetical protein